MNQPQPLRCVIIDANPVDRLQLGQIFKTLPNFTLTAEFSSAVDALDYLKYNKIDVLVLHAQLPVFNGFDFIDRLKDEVEVILTTTQANDAITAFQYGLVDCLQKPFSNQRFVLALQRVEKKITKEQLLNQTEQQSILVRSDFKNVKILLNDIKWIEAMGDYIKIVTEQKKYLVLSTMKEFVKKLPEKQFQRIHKSFIINLDNVQHYCSNSVTIGGKVLPLGRAHKAVFRSNYESY